jgi:hypothetical protein
MSARETTKTAEGRDHKGRFAKGNRGRPGQPVRPRGRRPSHAAAPARPAPEAEPAVGKPRQRRDAQPRPRAPLPLVEEILAVTGHALAQALPALVDPGLAAPVAPPGPSVNKQGFFPAGSFSLGAAPAGGCRRPGAAVSPDKPSMRQK